MKLMIQKNLMEEVEGLRNEYPYAFHHIQMALTEVPWHWHEALEFNLVLQGEVRVSTANQTQIFRSGEGFFINSNVLAAMEDGGGGVMDSHLFHPVFLTGHFKSVFETKYMNPVLQNRNMELICLRGETEHQKQILSKLRQLSREQERPDTEFQTRNLLSEMWLALLEEIKNTDIQSIHSRQKEQDRMLTMMTFIQENYAKKLTLEDIAASATISVRECQRCFRQAISQSPMDYLIEYRVRAAKKLLETTELSVSDIALRSGFNSNSYFAKIFQRVYGKSPNSYRKELRSLKSIAVEEK